MRIARVATYSAVLIALGGFITAPSAIAAAKHPAHPAHPAQPVAASRTVGHVAYLTKGGTVRLAAVHANGSTSGAKRIGPITAVTAKQSLQVFDLMASGDGKWVAWSEQVLTHVSGGFIDARSVLVVRNVVTDRLIHLNTAQGPIGFAGDQLVTSNADTTKRLVLTPTPHLVGVKDPNFPLAAYRSGVIDTVNALAPPGPSQTWRLELKSFAGQRTVLHNYVLGPTNYRNPDEAWVSGDGKHVVIERGNHQDFGGLGPSSLADEFRLTGGHTRSQLGHYGTNAAEWRIASVSYAGAHDMVWAVWERATKTGAASVVAVHKDGTWAPVTNHGIAVAGNAKGYVITQVGKYVSVGQDVPDFKTVPTHHAVLRHGSTARTLDIEASTFVWVR